jgi:hypothetical protein
MAVLLGIHNTHFNYFALRSLVTKCNSTFPFGEQIDMSLNLKINFSQWKHNFYKICRIIFLKHVCCNLISNNTTQKLQK